MRNIHLKERSLLIAFLAIMASVTAQSQVVFNPKYYEVDEWLKIVVCNEIPPSIPSGTTILALDKHYELPAPINKIEKGAIFKVTRSGIMYTIYFTELPIIKLGVSSLGAINHTTEISGTVRIAESSGEYYESPMGIRIRGASSASFDKKSYRVQLKDQNGANKDTTLFGLRNDKRWLFLAMFNEKLRLNNKVSHDLWLKMHKLYYAEDEPEANSTIRTVYAEVFVSGGYRGVYLIGEDTDRKQYQLKKTRDNGTSRGELYKADGWGNTEFKELPPIPAGAAELWGGWEHKYPDEINWSNLYNFTQFVMNSNNTQFSEQIGSKLRLDNAIDYLLFLNLVMAFDNKGKNTFLARYDTNEPYFIGVWDLDGTLGYSASSERVNSYNSFLKNELYDRLIAVNPEQFKQKAAGRWFTLREGLFKVDSLQALVTAEYDFLMDSKVYDREKILWSTSYSNSELNYIRTWIANRVGYLDSHFGGWITGCDAPVLAVDEPNFTNGEQVLINATGCFGIVKWYETSISVTPIAQGQSLILPGVYGDSTLYASCTTGPCVSTTRSSVFLSPDCSDNNLIYPAANQQGAEYKTRKLIESEATLTGNSAHKSEKAIILKAGFLAEAAGNKTFKATIEGCN